MVLKFFKKRKHIIFLSVITIVLILGMTGIFVFSFDDDFSDTKNSEIINDTTYIGDEFITTKNALLVKEILQFPELPTGCEITSLAIVLNYLGFNIDKVQLSDKYLAKISIANGDFINYFVGDPKKENGYGCFSKVIYNAAYDFLKDNPSDYSVYDISGSEFLNLFSQIDKGNPVILWTTVDLIPTYDGRIWKINSTTLTWPANEHCMVLTGYDLEKKVVYVCDPLKGNVSYDMNLFKDRYDQLGKQAIIIKSDLNLELELEIGNE